MRAATIPSLRLGDSSAVSGGSRMAQVEESERQASAMRSGTRIFSSCRAFSTPLACPLLAVIMALGTSPNPLIRSTTPGLETNKHGCIVTDGDDGKTSRDGVYAGGDAVTGAATVILAMGAGKLGAKSIDEYLSAK